MNRDHEAGLTIDVLALDALDTRLHEAAEQLAKLKDRWNVQRELAEKLLDLRREYASARLNPAADDAIDTTDAPDFASLKKGYAKPRRLCPLRRLRSDWSATRCVRVWSPKYSATGPGFR